jgi:hypothetical protein
VALKIDEYLFALCYVALGQNEPFHGFRVSGACGQGKQGDHREQNGQSELGNISR